jgi:hypothetical protein
MKYIMPCVLKSPVVEYHRGLVDDIADRFGLTFTRQQAIPAHLTLTDLRGEIQTSATNLLQQMRETESGMRRHFDVVGGALRSDIRAVVEGMAASRVQTDRRIGSTKRQGSATVSRAGWSGSRCASPTWKTAGSFAGPAAGADPSPLARLGSPLSCCASAA